MPKFSDLKPRDCFRFVNGAKWKSPETRSLIRLRGDAGDAVERALFYALPEGWAICFPYFHNGCANEEVELLCHFTTHPVPTPVYRS